MAMAPSGLAAPRTIPPISHGAQGGVELRSSLSGRALAKARPPSKTHSSRAASRLAVRAARQVGVQELSNGFTLYSYNLAEDSDSEDQAAVGSRSHAPGSARDAGSHAARVSKARPAADKVKSDPASNDSAAPQQRAPPKFIKLSPVPAARRRGQQKVAEAAEIRQAAEAAEAAKVPVVVSTQRSGIARPLSSFVKRSPVLGSLSKASGLGLGRNRVSPLKGVRLRSRFVKRSPLADFRQRRHALHQEQLREAGSLGDDPSSPLYPPLPPRPKSAFRKRSPVADWAARPRPVAAGKVSRVAQASSAAAPSNSKLLAARPPSNFQKKSPVVMAKAVFGSTARVRGVPAGADSSSTGAGDSSRLPSSFQKRSPVLDAQGRPVVIRAVSLEPKTASLGETEETPSLVGSPAGASASDPSSPSDTAASDASDSGSSSPERQPSRFKRVFRPLPATEPQVPASQIPIQAEPNGTPIHNRLPIAQPLGPQSPALMEDWGPAESSADGLVTVQETVTAQETVTVEETVQVQESVTLPEVGAEEIQPSSEEEGSGAGKKFSAEELSAMTVASLKELAKSTGLKGYSKLKKKELIQVLLKES